LAVEEPSRAQKQDIKCVMAESSKLSARVRLALRSNAVLRSGLFVGLLFAFSAESVLVSGFMSSLRELRGL
jgi:hypothetical protein